MAVNFQQLPHPGIRSLVPYKPGKSIEELAREKGINDSDIIKMAAVPWHWRHFEKCHPMS